MKTKFLQYVSLVGSLCILLGSVYMPVSAAEPEPVAEESAVVSEMTDRETISAAVERVLSYYSEKRLTYLSGSTDIVPSIWHYAVLQYTGRTTDGNVNYLDPFYNPDSFGEKTISVEYAKAILYTVLKGGDASYAAIQLAGRQQPDGSFTTDGVSQTPVYPEEQALIMLALDAVAADYNRTGAVSALKAYREEDGGYGNGDTQGSQVETTALVLTVLSRYQDAACIQMAEGAKAFLENSLGEDGSFLEQGMPVSAQEQALAISGLCAAQEDMLSESWMPAVEKLLSFQADSGGFLQEPLSADVIPQVSDLATSRSALALIEVLNGGNTWIAMSHDVYETMLLPDPDPEESSVPEIEMEIAGTLEESSDEAVPTNAVPDNPKTGDAAGAMLPVMAVILVVAVAGVVVMVVLQNKNKKK
ncbi:MAG TPA: terpene cyclase/mutase family protein [Firmicutes bacterium]|nr:terpene cyclase/mutase family protein [Bacillota bacterium]